ncbi:MAG: TonB-dependent receptor, partial [Bryobacteraceae bacterium]
PTPLDAHGGLVGLQIPIGAIDGNLKSPVAYNYSANLERKIGSNLVATVGYSGSRANDLLSGGGQTTAVNYGVDINAYAGDLVQHNSTVPTRLNPSFGPIYYTQNDRESSFNALIVGIRGRFGNRGFFNASYTRSASNDDTQVYPTALNPHQYFGPSIWDAPNRFSLAWNYELPGLNQGHGLVGRVTGGWELSGTTIAQSGTPYTVFTSASFQPLRDANGTITGLAPGSGDYNADGDNNDYPNVTSYSSGTSRAAYLNGVFSPSQFTTPALGTEGNEKWGQFRQPNFFETDAGLLKNTTITERVRLQLRFEFFNIFNRVNLGGIDSNLSDGTFGRATSQLNPRWIQIGANVTF